MIRNAKKLLEGSANLNDEDIDSVICYISANDTF